MLITGPFARRRATASDILTSWQAISGKRGRGSDPEFLHYATTVLERVTFEGKALPTFERLLVCLSTLLQGQGDPSRLAGEVELLRHALLHVAFADRMWEVTRAMVNQRTTRQWMSAARAGELGLMGVSRFPVHAAVGLLLAQTQRDALDDLVARDAFARALASACKKRGGVLSGKVSDHGCLLLLDDAGSGTRVQNKLLEIGTQARRLARSFGLELHLGIGPTSGEVTLPERYDLALQAAEQAATQGKSLVVHEPRAGRRMTPVRELHRELAQVVVSDPKVLPARFTRYFETLAALCGYRLEATRAHLEAGFERVSEAVHSAAALDERALAELESRLELAAAKAATLSELLAVYHEAISDIAFALLQPGSARHDRGLRRAIEYVREHLAHELTLGDVARVAGLAPAYFSRTFSRAEGVTFQGYVRRLRVEKAKHLLGSTTLSVERVGRFCGFRTRSLFHVAFKRATSHTPTEYRDANFRR